MQAADAGVHAYGDRAVLVDSAEPLVLAAALTGRAGVVDVVPGAVSVLVVTASPQEASRLVVELSARAPTAPRTPSSHDRAPVPGPERASGPRTMIVGDPRVERPAVGLPAGNRSVVELPVVYDGPDLAEVGRLTGLGADEVRRRHAAGAYTVAVVGFVPGFGYLSGLDPALAVPRRADPRPSVPAGSVAIGGPWTGVYPRATPGGWRLIGRTDAALWSLDRDPPALLRPGVRVRFVDGTP